MNQPFSSQDPRAGYRYASLAEHTGPENSEDLFVILAFSGGGTRAAAFAYGVLEKLRQTTVEVDGQRRRLLDEVDVISSNSGGSFTAAYYGLFRERMFDDAADPDARFVNRFLERDLEKAILSRVLFSPLNWARLASPAFNRSDLTAEVYDDEIYRGRTFSDLLQQGRPYLVINANDTTRGIRFEFTQDQFDLICSDTTGYPVARAVMASSAVHGLFGSLRLRNYDKANCAEPQWIASALGERTGNRGDLDVNRERYRRARFARSYRDKDPGAPADAKFYVHLSDGGTVDNLGMRAPLWSLRSTDPSWSVLRKLNLKKVKRIVVLSVNAASEPRSDMDRRLRGPGPVALIESAVSGAIDTVTLDSIQVTENIIGNRIRNLKKLGWDAVFYPPILIDFEHIRDPDLRECFKNVGTRLTLAPDVTRGVRRISYDLVSQSSGFRRFPGGCERGRAAGA